MEIAEGILIAFWIIFWLPILAECFWEWVWKTVDDYEQEKKNKKDAKNREEWIKYFEERKLKLEILAKYREDKPNWRIDFKMPEEPEGKCPKDLREKYCKYL